MKGRIRALAWMAVAAAKLVAMASSSSSSSTANKPIIVRVRMPDGAVERVAVDSLDRPLCDVLQPVCQAADADAPTSSSNSGGGSTMEVRLGGPSGGGSSSSSADDESLIGVDDRRTLAELSVRHGSLLTLVPKMKPLGDGVEPGAARSHNRRLSTGKEHRHRWDPFPDLAKDYEAARDQYERRKRSRTSASYSDLSDVRSQMHVVDPQPDGPLRRVYLCRICAERLNGLANPKPALEPPKKSPSSTSTTVEAAILFGSVARERVDPKHRPKTSLSSTTESQEYCHAAHVHAMYPLPPVLLEKLSSSSSSSSSARTGGSSDDASTTVLPRQVANVAKWLGLRVVGWMFAYRGQREEGVPLHANDVVAGARLQIDNMRKLQGGASSKGNDGEAQANGQNLVPSAFVTLAMDAESGATEAFQLSDVAVQMVAEDILAPAVVASGNGRTLSSRCPVVVDGQETSEVDSLLCLVNTALLSREGDYAGPPPTGGKVPSPVKKAGGLTTKTRKALAAAVRADDEQGLLRLLSDFALLVALHDLLGPEDCGAICSTVRKWSRLKRGVTMDSKLKERLRRLVENG